MEVGKLLKTLIPA